MASHSTQLANHLLETAAQTLDDDGERERIGQALVHALSEARLRFPAVSLDDVTFARFVGSHMADVSVCAGELARRALTDLYLTCACSTGDRAALATLDDHVFAQLPASLSRLKLGDAAIDEAVQRARAKLLVGQQGEGKIRDFSGTGDLRGWVRVIAIRDALRTARKGKREVSLSDELQAALPSQALEPDLAYQQQLYRKEFKEAFAAAVDGLSQRERSLLRQAIVYGSTVDQVAAVYQVHRATAARWIAKAREQLAELTREDLRQRLALSQSQFESVVRLIESQLELSVERLLATADKDAEP